jgi:hypothetical protein
VPPPATSSLRSSDPPRSQRRQRGRSDPIDALRVAGRQLNANRTQVRDLVAQMAPAILELAWPALVASATSCR